LVQAFLKKWWVESDYHHTLLSNLLTPFGLLAPEMQKCTLKIENWKAKKFKVVGAIKAKGLIGTTKSGKVIYA
jgi:hypothetical protein